MQHTVRSRRGPATAAVAMAATLFGTAGVARALGPDGLTDVEVGAWRSVIGGVGLLLFAGAIGRAPWRPRWQASILVAGAAVVGYQLAFFAAIDRIGVAAGTVVAIGTGPIVAGLLDRWFRGHRLGVRWFVGVVMAVSGIATLSGFAYDGVAAGWGLAVLAGVCYPVYGHVAQDLMSDRSAIEAIAAVFGAGAVLALPLAVPSTSRVTDDGAALLLVLYLGLVATALAYALWAFGLRTLPLRDTVTLTLVEPVAAAVLAAVVLEEPLTVLSWTAITAILGGVLLATSRAVERHAATSSGNRPVPPV